MEVHAVIQYEWACGTSVSVIHEHLQTMYDEDHLAYSPDLHPSDFHLLSSLKSAFSGHHFQNNVESVQQFFALQGTEFYQNGFLKLISWYDKCLSVKKWCE